MLNLRIKLKYIMCFALMRPDWDAAVNLASLHIWRLTFSKSFSYFFGAFDQ